MPSKHPKPQKSSVFMINRLCYFCASFNVFLSVRPFKEIFYFLLLSLFYTHAMFLYLLICLLFWPCWICCNTYLGGVMFQHLAWKLGVDLLLVLKGIYVTSVCLYCRMDELLYVSNITIFITVFFCHWCVCKQYFKHAYGHKITIYTCIYCVI